MNSLISLNGFLTLLLLIVHFSFRLFFILFRLCLFFNLLGCVFPSGSSNYQYKIIFLWFGGVRCMYFFPFITICVFILQMVNQMCLNIYKTGSVIPEVGHSLLRGTKRKLIAVVKVEAELKPAWSGFIVETVRVWLLSHWSHLEYHSPALLPALHSGWDC